MYLMETLDIVHVMLALKMMVIVTLITSVIIVSYVVQRIVQSHLVFNQTQIVVMKQLFGMKIFVHPIIHVHLVKVIVILMMNARMVYFVDQKIVKVHHQWIVVNLKVIHYRGSSNSVEIHPKIFAYYSKPHYLNL